MSGGGGGVCVYVRVAWGDGYLWGDARSGRDVSKDVQSDQSDFLQASVIGTELYTSPLLERLTFVTCSRSCSKDVL